MHYIRSGKSDVDILKLIHQFCISLKIQTPRVCEGVSQLFGVKLIKRIRSTTCFFTVKYDTIYLQTEVVYVLSKVTLGPDEICSLVIGDACGDVYNPLHEWSVQFPPVPKPVVPAPQAPTVSYSENKAQPQFGDVQKTSLLLTAGSSDV